MLTGLTVCSIAGYSDCVHERISLTEVKSTSQCVTTPQTVTAQWMTAHDPDRHAEWKCTTPGRLDRDA